MATVSQVSDMESFTAHPVLHILIVGFHHQKGSTIEFSHPPLVIPSSSQDSITTSLSQSMWRHLPHLALPDGCHNFEKESVYFTLQDEGVSNKSVYGVACCRQIESAKLLSVDDQITRSTVQKSLCVLCRYPAFGFIEAKLSLVTHAFFNAKDFTNVQILRETYNDINTSLHSASQISSLLYMDVILRELVTQFLHRLLQLYKALLLHRRVMIYGSTSIQASRSVLSILSLFPASLEKHAELDSSSSSYLSLNIFTSTQSFHPYICLQQMEELRSSPCVLVGVVNPLFEKQQSKLCDVFADISTGLISIHSDSLKPCLHLSTADLRFCSLLSDNIREQSGPQSDWLGSNEWIRAQFKHYLISLLKTSLEGEDIAKSEFNQDFMHAWCSGPVYKSWLDNLQKVSSVTTMEPKAQSSGIKPDIFTQTQPVHICTGELSVGDLKRRLMAQVSDFGVNIDSREQVVQRTQQAIAVTTERVTNAVSQVWNSASSAMHRWWGGSQEHRNDN